MDGGIYLVSGLNVLDGELILTFSLLVGAGMRLGSTLGAGPLCRGLNAGFSGDYT